MADRHLSIQDAIPRPELQASVGAGRAGGEPGAIEALHRRIADRFTDHGGRSGSEVLAHPDPLAPELLVWARAEDGIPLVPVAFWQPAPETDVAALCRWMREQVPDRVAWTYLAEDPCGLPLLITPWIDGQTGSHGAFSEALAGLLTAFEGTLISAWLILDWPAEAMTEARERHKRAEQIAVIGLPDEYEEIMHRLLGFMRRKIDEDAVYDEDDEEEIEEDEGLLSSTDVLAAGCLTFALEAVEMLGPMGEALPESDAPREDSTPARLAAWLAVRSLLDLPDRVEADSEEPDPQVAARLRRELEIRVGVAADVVHQGLEDPPPLFHFVPAVAMWAAVLLGFSSAELLEALAEATDIPVAG